METREALALGYLYFELIPFVFWVNSLTQHTDLAEGTSCYGGDENTETKQGQDWN